MPAFSTGRKRRLLHRQLDDEQRSWLQDALRAGLEEIPSRYRITVFVHPEVAEMIDQHLDAALQNMDDAPSRPQVSADAAMLLRACRIECQGTVVDVGLQGAWERVAQHLLRQAPDQDFVQTVVGDAAIENTVDPEAAP